MKKRTREEQTISDVLKDFVSANKLEKGLDQVQVKDIWMQMMGQAVAAYTDDVQLKGATLYISLKSAPLREELSYGKQKIIEMMNRELGKELVSKLILR
ncbi:DUF721 domain-containing protein [Spongiivirga citrea]|uniref:DUF721 domain-containing protein n=1 Tax=Spongiivirga citrea TaxID=1481457 RepID=A0A6M0CSS1_9FLAO|nr:DUF721 domain-containing protein [Spongiivirga citrea]NER18547.1 DUF721 domain-containing protein [Spongiivirga citrea]